MADQTCTITPTSHDNYTDGRIVKILWEWKSATGGAVVAAGAVGVGSTTPRTYSGYVASFHTKPGATTPTAYTITLYDDDGRPISTKTSASTTVVENHSAGHVIGGTKLSIVISSAGDAKTGSAWAYLYCPA